MKMIVFWDASACSLVEFYTHFKGACCLHHQNTTRRNTPNDSHLGTVYTLLGLFSEQTLLCHLLLFICIAKPNAKEGNQPSEVCTRQ